MNWVPLPEELPVIDLVDTSDALGQHRFPGPVIATEGSDLSAIEVQVHLGEGLNRAEMLVDAAGLEPRLGRRRFVDHLAHRFTLSRGKGLGAAAKRRRHPFAI